jgi:hypothetical protein
MTLTEIRAHPVRRILGVVLAPLRGLEQARGRRRLVLAAVYLLAVVAVGAAALWVLGVRGLPDVGDPFDLAAEPTVPASQDATPLYEQAGDALGSYPGREAQGVEVWRARRLFRETPVTNDLFTRGWSGVGPDIRRWVEANRGALELWRQATDRPTASISHRYGPPWRAWIPLIWTEQYSLFAMALLEGSRREEAGDLAGAWAWYRAALRSIRQLGTLDAFTESHRLEQAYHPMVQTCVARWARHRRINAELLRQAVADVVALDQIPERDVQGFREAYRDVMRRLNRASAEGPLDAMRRFVLHEPERSRRVVRLFFGNWLGHLPALHTGTGSLIRLNTSLSPHARVLLTPRPGVRPAPGGLSPEALAAWHESTIDAKRLLPDVGIHYQAWALRGFNQSRLLSELRARLQAFEPGSVPDTRPKER